MLRAKIAAWLDAHASPDWRNAHRLHSFQVAMVLAVLQGAWAAVPAFQSMFPPVRFLVLCVFVSVVLMIVRFTKQPDVPDVPNF